MKKTTKATKHATKRSAKKAAPEPVAPVQRCEICGEPAGAGGALCPACARDATHVREAAAVILANERHARPRAVEITTEVIGPAMTSGQPEAERQTFNAPAIASEFKAEAILEAMLPIAKTRGTAAAKVASRAIRFLRIHAKHPYGRKGQQGILALAAQATTIEKELAALRNKLKAASPLATCPDE